MALNDPLAKVLSNILNAETKGKKICFSKPVSKVITQVLDILKSKKYIGSYKIIEDKKGEIIEINLIGKINKCGVIKPRYPVKKDGFEKFEKRYLPAKGFGVIIVSTHKGIMPIEETQEQKIGGRLIAYCY